VFYWIDSLNFNAQNIDNTAFVKQLIFDDLINKPLNVNTHYMNVVVGIKRNVIATEI
jgi:hypothetical protein